jgi:acyl dehydratase
MRLMVESVPLAEGIIGTSGELTWPRPTRPGGTRQVESEFIELIPSRSNPKQGSATLKTTTRNQNAGIVQTFTCKIVVARRPA